MDVKSGSGVDHGTVMRIEAEIEGVLLERVNRFLSVVDADLNGRRERLKVHVHDPGRLEEILYPGNRVLLREAAGGNRKTSFDLIAGRVGGRWVLVNSMFHSDIAASLLAGGGKNPFPGYCLVKREVKVGGSRFDMLLRSDEDEMLVEIKGCTLTEGGTALFPDAVTARGARHVLELASLAREKMSTAVLFLVLGPPATQLMANRATDPAFADAILSALDSGVSIRAVRMGYEPPLLLYEGSIPVVGI